MDESTSSPVPESTEVPASVAPEAMNTTGDQGPQPAGDTNAEATDKTPSKGNPEPSGPAPETTDPTLPDHGIDPDKGINPDAGDLPTNPDPPLDSKTDDGPVDLKAMSRAERAAYFKEQAEAQKQQVEQAISQAYQPQEVNELRDAYIEAGYDEGTALILARGDVQEQRAQLAEDTGRVANLNAGMAVEAMELMHTIDWMNPANKDSFDQKTLDAGSHLYDTLAVVRDERTAEKDTQGNPVPGTGQIVQAKLSPKQFWSAIDQIRQAGAEQARLEGQKAAERQMAAVAPPTSNTNQRTTPFDSLSASDMRAQLLAKGVNVT